MYHTEAREVHHRRRLLRRRGRVFYYRQRAPRAVVPIVGRIEVQRSLRTADHREALLRAAVIEARLPRRWDALLAKREQTLHTSERRPVCFIALLGGAATQARWSTCWQLARQESRTAERFARLGPL